MTDDEELKSEAQDAVARRDLASKYAGVQCPVHGTPPEFEVAPDGSVTERFCCEALVQIIRELEASKAAEG
jgi:hypothetical protein